MYSRPDLWPLAFLELMETVEQQAIFLGFDVAPNVDLQITGTQCLPGANLEVIGEVFDAYQWFFDGNLIAGATGTTYNPTVAGDYYVRVTKGPCSYDSNNL